MSSHLLSEIEVVADDIENVNHVEIVVTGPLAHVKESLASLEDVFFSIIDSFLNASTGIVVQFTWLMLLIIPAIFVVKNRDVR